MTSARKVLRITSLAGALFLLVLLGYTAWGRFTEPRYKGKPVSYWFHEFSALRLTNAGYHLDRRGRHLVVNNVEVPDRALEALVAIGEPAASYLGKQLSAPNALDIPLYRRVFTNLPLSVRSVLPNPFAVGTRRVDAAAALISFGKKAQPHIPAIIDRAIKQPGYPTPMLLGVLRFMDVPRSETDRLLTGLLEQGRYAEARHAISELNVRSPAAARVVAEMLASADGGDKWHFETLREQGSHAAVALPTLLKTINSTNQEVRYQTVRTLETIGPAAVAALPALFKCSDDTSSMVQSAAKRAINAITQKNSTDQSN